jgi:hypothetical protein
MYIVVDGKCGTGVQDGTDVLVVDGPPQLDIAPRDALSNNPSVSGPVGMPWLLGSDKVHRPDVLLEAHQGGKVPVAACECQIKGEWDAVST